MILFMIVTKKKFKKGYARKSTENKITIKPYVIPKSFSPIDIQQMENYVTNIMKEWRKE